MNAPVPHNDHDSSRRAQLMTWSGFVAAVTFGMLIVGGALAILNWLYIENNRLRAELSAVRIEMIQQQSNKVSKEDFVRNLTEINERFERGFDRLERRITALIEQKKKAD